MRSKSNTLIKDTENTIMKKHILCFGDSNTHGKCADPNDCADNKFSSLRFNEDERWPMLLKKHLGEDFLIIEEGLTGRTTVFEDPIHYGLSGIAYLEPCLKTHAPIDVLIIMLGTNDVKDRFPASAPTIGKGMERLIKTAKSIDCWATMPNILIICPAPYDNRLYGSPEAGSMGLGAVEKSQLLAAEYEKVSKANGCRYLNADGIAEYNEIDFIHLTKKGHKALADAVYDAVAGMV